MNHSLLFCLIAFLAGSCASPEEKLQGKWVCIENCNEIQTLHFYKDSLEINRFMKHLRGKEFFFFKIVCQENSLFGHNTFYDIKRKQEFKYKLENDTLLFDDNSVFIKSESNILDDNNLYLTRHIPNFEFPKVTEITPTKIKYTHQLPDIIFFTKKNSKPIFYYKNRFYELMDIENVLQRRCTHLNEEKAWAFTLYLAIDKYIQIEDLDSAYSILRHYAPRLRILYRNQLSVSGIPENTLIIPIVGSGTAKYYPWNDPNLVKHTLPKNKCEKYLHGYTDSSTVFIKIDNNKIYVNNRRCNNLNELSVQIKKKLNPQLNSVNYVLADSSFINEMLRYYGTSSQEADSNYSKTKFEEFWFKRENASQIKKYHLPIQRFNISIFINRNSDFHTWFQVYFCIRNLISKENIKNCQKYFETDYLKLNPEKYKHEEIIRFISSMNPKLIPLIIKDDLNELPL